MADTWGINQALFIVICLIVGLCGYFLVNSIYDYFKRINFSVKDRHVIVTGGSKGLGLCLAKQFADEGARVTIIARNRDDLEAAKATIEQSALLPHVVTISADVTDEEQVNHAVKDAIEQHGPVFMLVACAGSAHTGYFSELRTAQFQQSMNLNYMGVVHAVRAVVGGMKTTNEGHIVVVSSGLALTGYIGYSAYAPTKWALRGLCEVLRNELQPFGVSVYNAYPPGMDTPGFEVENRTKPAECQAIEAGETTYKPEYCARHIIDGIKSGHFHIACGDFGIGLLTRACAGMSPRNSAVGDALWLLPIVLIGIIYRGMWDSEVKKSKYRYESAVSTNKGEQQQATAAENSV